MDFRLIMEMNKLATDTICLEQTQGIPTFWCNIMEHNHIERIAGVPQGHYKKDPEKVYIACQRSIGVNILDQYIPANPLVLGEHGYENTEHGATTGADKIVCDGIEIDSPEQVIEHLESVAFVELKKAIYDFDEDKRTNDIIVNEKNIQEKLGLRILKSGYEFISFPYLSYGKYGYKNYFMAFALYPEMMEKHFSLQADLALLNNKAALRAYTEANLPPLYRLDHDMADSRSTLVNIKMLDKIWFPHFQRSLKPILDSKIRMIWHCDGNLMQMVPRLLDVGIKGFQGFQYEDGMDYEKICKMKTKEGEDLIIWAGVSVTRTLPFGSSEDVKKELKWLVEKGPKTGLFLGISSSMAPGVKWDNVETLIEGLQYYRNYGRETY